MWWLWIRAQSAKLAPVTAVCAVALATPTMSSAAVHSGGAEFVEPTNEPTIGGPPPPRIDTEEADKSVSATYDDQAGALTISVSVYDPSHWGGQHAKSEITVGPTCEQSDLEGQIFEPHEGGVLGASVTLNGYGGEVNTLVTFNGQSFTTTLKDPRFAGREWHCFAMSSPQGSESFGLGGWPKLNPSADTAAVLARIGHQVPPIERNYVCPSVEIFNGNSGCFAEYQANGKWHLVEAGVKIHLDEYAVTIYYTRSWHRHWTINSAKCRRSWHVPGHLETNLGDCAASLVKDVPYELKHHRHPKLVGWDGTDTAGFDPMSLYPCHTRSDVVTCTNKLGDSVRYRR